MIEVSHLTKRYGAHLAVSDLSFNIEDGQIYGFLGPNGAGKSTTMNIMTGCLAASSGEVRIDGHDIFEESGAAKRLLGYLPEQPPLYMDRTPREYLTFVGHAKGLSRAQLAEQMERVMSVTQIGDVADRLIKNLSKGYRQRVGIAQALLGRPEAIILDEPTVGLDPLQIVEIRELISQLGESRTVLISSHILSEVQNMCSKILIIAHGRLIAFDEPARLEERLSAPGEIVLTAETDAETAEALVADIPNVASIHVRSSSAELSTLEITAGSGDIHSVSREIFLAFAGSGHVLSELGVKKANLEDIFLELTESRDGTIGEGEKKE